MPELLFPHARSELKDVLVRMHADAIEHIDEVGVGVNALQTTGHQ